MDVDVNANLQAVLALRRGQRVRLYYDVSNSKSAVYVVVAVSAARVVYQSPASGLSQNAPPAYVASKLVQVLD